MTPDFDPARLREYLSGRFGARDRFDLARISGGQSNPTYFLRYGPDRMVLRKKPAGPTLPGAHAIDREYRVLQALYPSGVPVPRPILYCDDPLVLGTPFYLMERVEGRVFSDCALPDLALSERPAIWMGLAEALAALHNVDPVSVGLGDYGRPGNYFERQIARWTKQWQASANAPIPDLDALAEWLPAHLPADDGAASLAHGDFRLGNLMFHPTEPRVVAILDWELSTLGHPLADLGFAVMPWHTAPQEYGGLLGLDLAGQGLPQEADVVARYRQRRPGCSPLLPFHKVFALFRFAVIFVGISDRVRAGTAAAANADSYAPLAARFARRAADIINRTEETP